MTSSYEPESIIGQATVRAAPTRLSPVACPHESRFPTRYRYFMPCCARNITTCQPIQPIHIENVSAFPNHDQCSIPIMNRSTPISRSKSAALARVLDLVPRGYLRYFSGIVAPTKAAALARKFDKLYAIAATPAQRLTRKHKGFANCRLILYWPDGAQQIEWMIVATDGDGLESEARNLHYVTHTRMSWLHYELVRRPTSGITAWTWRRPREVMRELVLLLSSQTKRRDWNSAQETLLRAARQPGFHGVREQSRTLCQIARKSGYKGELPALYFMRKIAHGEPLAL